MNSQVEKNAGVNNPGGRSRWIKIVAFIVCIALAAGYFVYDLLTADAHITGNKYLVTVGTRVATGASIVGGTVNDTKSSNDVRLQIREGNSAALRDPGYMTWDFSSWDKLTETTADKVYRVTVTMESSLATAGDNETIQFSLLNVAESVYGISTGTIAVNSTTDSTRTVSFPITDYTDYFFPDGSFRIRMADTYDTITTTRQDTLRIDYLYTNIEYDITNPTATWSSPSGNPTAYYTNSEVVNLSASGTDNTDNQQSGISAMKFFYNNGTETLIGSDLSVDSGTANNGTWNYTKWKPVEGTYTVYAKAYDAKNNISSATASQTIVVDRTAPSISVQFYRDPTLLIPLETANGKVFAAAGQTVYAKLVSNEVMRTNADDNEITIDAPGALSDVTGADFDGSMKYAWTINGGTVGDTTSITLKGTDMAGNSTTVSSPVIVTIDNTPPTLSLQYYHDAGLTDPLPVVGGKVYAHEGNVYVKLVGSEPLSNVAGDHKLSINAPGTTNDFTNQDFTYDSTVSAWVYTWDVKSGADGDTVSVTVTGKDMAGNETSGAPSSGSSVRIDTVLPAADISMPANSEVIKAVYAIKGTATDNADFDYYMLEYYKDGTGPWTQIGSSQTTQVSNNTLISWDTTAVDDGYYDVRLSVYDQAHNVSTSTKTNVNIDNDPPVVNLQYYSDAGLTQPLVTVNGVPRTKSGTSVYIKLVPDDTLRSNAGDNQITIDAPGTANDVTNADFTWNAGPGAWVYTWNVVPDTDGNAAAAVKATSVTGNVSNGTPASGGTVTIDNNVVIPFLLYTIENGQITLEWGVEPDHAKYYIYRSGTSGFVPDGGTLLYTIDAPAGSTTFGYTPGTYYYRLVVEDKNGNLSPPSGEVTVYQGAAPAKPYLRYYNNGAYVSIAVYWNDANGGSGMLWADDVTENGGSLYWQNLGLSLSGLGTSNASAVISDAVPYKNYYFKLTQGGKATIIRAYPVEFQDPPDPIPPLGTETVNGLVYYTGPRYTNEYAHGNYSPDTNMCGACHSTHSALKAQLMKQATYYDLCLLCHGTAANQSKYDVQSGKMKTSGGWVDSLAGPIGSDYGVSKHNVDDRASVDTTVYGSSPGKLLTFTCISCHYGHAGSNDNYRLIRNIIYPSNDRFVATTVYYSAYAIVKDPAVGEEVYMVSGNTQFCSACHLDYDDGSTEMAGGAYTSYFRHPVTVNGRVYSVYRSSPLRNWYPGASDNLPLQYNGSGESLGEDKRTAVVCSTCHYAHGSYKAFNVGYPNANGIPRTFVQNQKMLRLDNYAVCESCHKK